MHICKFLSIYVDILNIFLTLKKNFNFIVMAKMTFIPKERLKNARTQRGYKQSEFAERVAMDQS